MTDQEILDFCFGLESKDSVRSALEKIFQQYNKDKDYSNKFRVHSVLGGLATSVPYILGIMFLDGVAVSSSDMKIFRLLLKWSTHINEYQELIRARKNADYTYAVTSADRKLKEFKHTMTTVLSNAYHNKPTGEPT